MRVPHSFNTEAGWQKPLHLQDGWFDQDRMLQSFDQMASGNAEGGFPLSRIVCRMDWVPDGQSHIDELIEFEARFNDVWCRHDDAVDSTAVQPSGLAAKDALLNMINHLVAERGYSREQAYCLTSRAVDLRISELVDVPNVTVSAFLPLDILSNHYKNQPKITRRLLI